MFRKIYPNNLENKTVHLKGFVLLINLHILLRAFRKVISSKHASKLLDVNIMDQTIKIWMQHWRWSPVGMKPEKLPFPFVKLPVPSMVWDPQ